MTPPPPTPILRFLQALNAWKAETEGGQASLTPVTRGNAERMYLSCLGRNSNKRSVPDPQFVAAERQYRLLQMERNIWHVRQAAMRKTGHIEETIRKFIGTSSRHRQGALYLERFDALPLIVAHRVGRDGLAPHLIPFDGHGLPDRWEYLTGLHVPAAELRPLVQQAQAALSSRLNG